MSELKRKYDGLKSAHQALADEVVALRKALKTASRYIYELENGESLFDERDYYEEYRNATEAIKEGK